MPTTPWMGTGAALAIGAVLAVMPAGAARASSVLAEADGIIWGTPDGERNGGTGVSPVAAVAAYERPPIVNDGRFNASAAAWVGSLAAEASLSVSNAPGYLSAQYPFYGESRVYGLASFMDQWIFGGQPLDTPGALRLTFTFEGGGDGSATGAVASVFGRLNVDLTSLAEFGNGHDSAIYNSGELQAADETVMLELDFLYGRPVNVRGILLATVQLNSMLTVFSYSGGGAAEFGNTAEFTLLEVQDALGNWTTDYDLGTESDGVYPFQAAVPEPAAMSALVVGLLGLVAARRRAAN